MTNAEVAPVADDFAERGLTSSEVEERKRRGDVNAVEFEASRSYARILFDNAISPVNVILFVIAGVLIGLGLPGDAFMTGGLVLGNVVVGVAQEGRAKRQLDRIALLTRPTGRVIRDGEEQTIDPGEIVRGDLVIVRAGNQVQVDGSVLRETSMSVDEALLTGEADLVRKRPGDSISAGSYCMTGEALVVAEAIGAERLSHKITASARSYRDVRTPLQEEVSKVIWGMAALVALLGIAVANSFLDIYNGFPAVESARAAAVVVALVPQGLWFMITVAYSMAIVRTARGGVLIQRMNAVESISRVDILCIDKTGTLTTNQLHMEEIRSLGMPEEELNRCLGTFAASASFKNRTTMAIEKALEGHAQATTAEVVFDSARKWSALALPDGIYVMGAPEILQANVTKGTTQANVSALAEEGLRVLLFARAADGGAPLDAENPELPQDLQALGLVILSDELRKDAAETVGRFGESGVKLKILSGDNPTTVAALARQAGFGAFTAVSGAEIDGLSDDELAALAERTTIFGRITPLHKEKLVQALKNRGHYVAMIGDGINDIPALKASHVAVAMRSGNDATRNVADIVLMDDSFPALSKTFSEGQRIREGMASVLRLFLVRTVSVAIVVLIAALISDPFPLTPRQTGIVATLTVGLPAVALAAWAKPGRGPNLLLPSALGFVLPAGIALGLASAVTYSGFLAFHASRHTASSALLAVAIFCGIALIPYVVEPPRSWLSTERPEASGRPIGASRVDAGRLRLRVYFQAARELL